MCKGTRSALRLEGGTGRREKGRWLRDVGVGDGPGMHGSMIYGHLWSELIPATRPAFCISEQGHSPGGTARGMADPEVTHLVCCICTSWLCGSPSASVFGHVTRPSVTCLEVKLGRESDTGGGDEREAGTPLWDHKNWVGRAMFLHSPSCFHFLLQWAELSGEIYSISIEPEWKLIFIMLCSLNLSLSPSASSRLTNDDIIVWISKKLPSSFFLLLMTEDWGLEEDGLASWKPQCISLVWVQHLFDVFGLLEPISCCSVWNSFPKYITLFDLIGLVCACRKARDCEYER